MLRFLKNPNKKLRFVIYGAAYATESLFSLVFFSHYNDLWYLTLHFTQTKKHASTYLHVYKYLWMNWILLKIYQNHGAKKAKKTRQSFSIGYLGIWSFKNGPKVSVWPPNCILYNYKFVGTFWSPFHTQMLWNQITRSIVL